MNKTVNPDYNNCILNITSSILNHFGVQHRYPTIETLDKFLSKKYKNIVFMVFDGMGVDMLEHNLPHTSFLRSNMKQQITSVFPSTTTAAMTAYYSGLSPNEHGWLGWSLYFKEFNSCIDTFTNQDSYTKLNNYKKHAAYTLMPYKSIYQMIDEVNKSVKSYTIIPEGINFPDSPNINIRIKNVERIFGIIENLCKNQGNKFIMSYWYEPDMTMHKEGCYVNVVKTYMQLIDELSFKMYKGLDDTLVIISADHGLINVTEEIYLNDIPEIDECLVIPPSIESRAVSLFIKPKMDKIFEERFYKYFGNDFKLIAKEEVLNSEILGKGKPHKKVTDFIGNYLACAIGNKMIRYRTLTSGEHYSYKGQHAGLTKEEMIVPLIILE